MSGTPHVLVIFLSPKRLGTPDFTDFERIRTMSVIVFTKNGCQPCKATKKKLDKEGVAFVEINMDEHPESVERVRKLGYSAAPVVLTESDHWAGFQPDRIMALKALKAA